MRSLRKKAKIGSWICLCLCLLLTVGLQQGLVQMANYFTKYWLKKFTPTINALGQSFPSRSCSKTWWHSWRCLWTYKSNSFDLSPSCIFVSIQPFFSSLECPLAKVKELCGMFQNSFNGFQVLWATSQPAGTPYQLHARCVIGLPVLQLKLFIALLFFLDYTQDFLLYAKKKKFNFSNIVVFLKNIASLGL